MEGRIPAYYTNAEQTAVYRTGRVDVRNDQVKWTTGYRLATEAEWEMAARGGTTGRRYSWSDSNGISHSRANYGFDSNFQAGGMPYTSPVGYFAANAYGLYDMTGNVYAWCWDWGAPYSSATQTNPRGPTTGSGRIIRGGGWAGYESDCRAAFRTIHTSCP
jgi:formylglycine-generating enzyme required for sulfatase activity